MQCCSRGIATYKSARLSVRQQSGQISDDFDFRVVTSFYGTTANGTDLVHRRRFVDDDVDQLSADRHHWRAQNMGQLLTLMVFGDAITIDNDDADDDEIGAATPGPGRGSPALRSAAAG